MLMKAHSHIFVEKTPVKAAAPDDEMPERLRLWQANHCFKCPVVGMCLTISEQKRLLKKIGGLNKGDGPFEMHEKMVTVMDTDNRLSRRIDHLLHRKYAKKAEALFKLDDEAFVAHSKCALDAGEADVVLWVAAISPDLSAKSRRAVFGDIHMTMHWNGEQLLKFKRKIAQQQREITRLQKRLKDAAQMRRALKKENRCHLKESANLQSLLAAARKEQCNLRQCIDAPSNDKLSALEKEIWNSKQACKQLRNQLATSSREVITLMEKNRELGVHLDRQIESNRHVKDETREIIAELMSMNRCDTSCPAFDLCKKRVLIVGGITRMESLYRDLIEGSNGVFEYHDGYVKKGVKDLEGRMKRADMVLCPVNCNSHAACSMVKNLGKKHNKTVHIIANSSLSAVTQVIWGDMNGDAKHFTLN